MKVSVPLQIIDLHSDGFHPLVEIILSGKPFTVVLDTGASKTAFDKNLFLQANKNALLNISERLSTGLGTNTMRSFTTTVPDFCIGNLKISDLEVAVLDLSAINLAYGEMGHPQVLGVLGGDILMAYKAVIDYGERVITFNS